MTPGVGPKPASARAAAASVCLRRLGAAAALACFCLGRCGFAQEEVVARTVLAPGLTAGLVTEEGRAADVGKIWFATAKDLSNLGPGGPPVGWETEPPLPPFESIREIVVHPVTREWRGSDAGRATQSAEGRGGFRTQAQNSPCLGDEPRDSRRVRKPV